MCPISVFVAYFILWKNQQRVALDLHKKQCRDKGELRPIFKFCFFSLLDSGNYKMRYFRGREAGSRPLGGLLEAQWAICGSLLGAS